MSTEGAVESLSHPPGRDEADQEVVFPLLKLGRPVLDVELKFSDETGALEAKLTVKKPYQVWVVARRGKSEEGRLIQSDYVSVSATVTITDETIEKDVTDLIRKLVEAVNRRSSILSYRFIKLSRAVRESAIPVDSVEFSLGGV